MNKKEYIEKNIQEEKDTDGYYVRIVYKNKNDKNNVDGIAVAIGNPFNDHKLDWDQDRYEDTLNIFGKRGFVIRILRLRPIKQKDNVSVPDWEDEVIKSWGSFSSKDMSKELKDDMRETFIRLWSNDLLSEFKNKDYESSINKVYELIDREITKFINESKLDERRKKILNTFHGINKIN